jgi:hypothetical protein
VPLIHWPNLRFEDQLAGRISSGPESLRRLTTELSILCGLVAAPEDVVLVDQEGLPDELPECLAQTQFLTPAQLRQMLLANRSSTATNSTPTSEWRLQPWGWSPAAAELLTDLGLAQSPPNLTAIRTVNTREFAAAFDVLLPLNGQAGTADFSAAEPFGSLCRSETDVLTALHQFATSGTDRWVIKANISHAARNRLLGTGHALTADHRAWLARRLGNGEPVTIEPWLIRHCECGLQWDVAETVNGFETRFVGATEMLTDAAGQYRGSLLQNHASATTEMAWWHPAVIHGRRIVEAAAREGFRGPLGIDCMLVEHRGRQFLRPGHDINGRQTMGRLALALQKLIPPASFAAWCHISGKSVAESADFRSIGTHSSVRSVNTGPGRVGGRPCTLQSRLLLSHDRTAVVAAAARLTGANPR